MRFPARAAAVLAAGLAAACAPRNTGPAATGAETGRAAGAGFGTIVALRPVAAQAQAPGSDVRGTILGAIGGAGAVDDQAGHSRFVEFIVREDAGGTVSVVQTDDEDFRAGERIVITGGARARLTRPAPPPGT